MYEIDDSRGIRKKQKGAQKVLQEYASVIAVAVLFLATCTMVALRGNTIYWKNEAVAAQKSLNAAHVKHVHVQDAALMKDQKLREAESKSANLMHNLTESERKLADIERRLSTELHHVATLNAGLSNTNEDLKIARKAMEAAKQEVDSCNLRSGEHTTSSESQARVVVELTERVMKCEHKEMEAAAHSQNLNTALLAWQKDAEYWKLRYQKIAGQGQGEATIAANTVQLPDPHTDNAVPVQPNVTPQEAPIH